MKKITICVFSLIFVFLFSGCSGINDLLEEKMLEKSGIRKEESYISYQNKVESGNVDEDGFYQEDVSEDNNGGTIHVTFAKNNNLDIKYYKDKAHTILINDSACNINPGEKIYAEVAVNADVYSSMYEFAEFHIYSYSDSGERTRETNLEKEFIEENAILEIPVDYNGNELSIEPVGKYEKRTINLNDYFVDDNDNKIELDGTWLINDVEYTDNAVQINPMESYIISYAYDNNEYFYLASEPDCYYNNNDDGIVIFNQKEATDETANYSVELHKYISVSLTSDTDRKVKVNNQDEVTVKLNNELLIPKLQYGKPVILETDKVWPDLEKERELILTNEELLSNGNYKYTFAVPDKNAVFEFDPSEYSYEHGIIRFKCFGTVVDGVQSLAKGSKIYYEQDSADEGYWLSETNHYIVVGEPEETRKALEEIHFTQKVQTSIKLKQPEYGGKISYSVNGKKINDEDYSTFCGTIITMDFEPWEGWTTCEGIKDGIQYKVNNENGQTITANGIDINNIFVESDSHKPELTVILKKSVEEDIKFDFAASGIDSTTYSYTNKWYRSDYTVIDRKQIGTEKPITISMENKAIKSGKAIKVVIEKVDSDKKSDTPEVRYVDDLTTLQDPIFIYKDNVSSKTWYKSIKITISYVDVVRFEPHQSNGHSSISVRNATTRVELSKGDFIEENQKVIVTITPIVGYYISGGNIQEKTAYEETMTYSKYVSDIDDRISEHPVKKICEVTLDTTDSFAKYVYKIDGKEVSGTVQIKEGEKISLEYEITDDNYSLQEGAGGVFGIGKSYKKVSKEIVISEDYDGKTIKKDDFNIKVKKGE